MYDLILSYLENLNTLKVVISIIISIICGLSVRMILPFCDQRWAQTYHHTVSYALLPAITFVITKVISGNIALSLGMIGALSIVRFRTPVKNPLELIIFFALITIGISCAVRVDYAIFLTLTIILVLVILKYGNYYYSKKFGEQITQLSFGDGNRYHTLEVTAKSSIEDFKSSEKLIQSIENSEEKIYIYKFATKNLNDTKKLQEYVKNFKDKIINITTDFNH
tara:strand:- start:191 stop:859 length:669 start_codon:yes stop_codon:yes gene_type:complete